MTRAIAAVILFFAACGGGGDDDGDSADAPAAVDAGEVDAAPPDAAFFDRSCYDDPPPATAPDPITVSTRAFILDGSPLEGALVEVLDAADAVLASGTTGAGGTVDLVAATGGLQQALRVRFSKDGYSDTYQVVPAIHGPTIFTSLALYQPADWEVIHEMVDETWDPAKALVFVFVNDCATDRRVAGVSAAFEPAAGFVGYLDSTVQPPIIDPALTATTPSGNIYGLNVPAGPSTVTLSYGGEAFRTFTLDVVGGTRMAISGQP